MNKIIEDQLRKVEYADLSNFNPETNTYIIKKRVDLKIEEDGCYLIKLKSSAFNNQGVIVNWNNNSMPEYDTLKVDVSKKMGKMIKIVGLGFDLATNTDTGKFWSGWLSEDDITVLRKL